MITPANPRRRSALPTARTSAALESLESRQLLSADFNVAATAAVAAQDTDDPLAPVDLDSLSSLQQTQMDPLAALRQDSTQSRLISPIGRISDRSPAFEWSAVSGAVRYEIWVHNRDTNQRSLYSDQLTSTRATTNVELAEGNYRWWVRAWDQAGRAGSWSEPADFTISTQQLGQPQPQTPSGRVSTPRPEFQWSAVDGAARYELWVTSLNTGQRVLHGDQLTGTSARGNIDLQAGNYRWWVRAFSSNGTPTEWSQPLDFSVSAQQATRPQPQNPSGQVSTPRPEFQWSAVDGAARYELWVTSLDSGQRVLHSDQLTGTSARGNIDLQAGNYRWWVRAFSSNGTPTEWSQPLDFSVTRQQSVTTPDPLSPTGTIDGANPRFEWTAVTAAVRYELWVTHNESRQRVIHDTNVQTSSADFSGQLAEGTYTWWVRAFDASNRSTDWSQGQTFQVAAGRTGGGAVAELVGPRGRTDSSTPRFEWTQIDGAVRYELWVSSLDSNRRVLHSDELTSNFATISNGQLADGNYRWWVRGFDAQGRASQWSAPADFSVQTGGGDDQYENNDSISQSADLGALTTTARLDNLSLADGEDWFTFTMNGTGTADDYVGIAFDHSRGDIDLRLYDQNGTMLLVSDTVQDQEAVSLNGLPAGRYFVRVHGYNGATNPSYTMEINPGSSGQDGGGDQTAYRTLYMNFDGVQLSHQDLLRYSQGRWDQYIAVQGGLDPERDGVLVQPFRPNDSRRDAIIGDIVQQIQQDLNAYGIRIQRITGGAVEGQGATTIFVGVTSLLNPGAGVASDVDRGNDNPTDIAFANDTTQYANYQDYVMSMADLILHEAGHTWGLHHVDTLLGGTFYAETMGLRYTAGLHNLRWNAYPDTAFMDITFHEFINAQGHEHGLRPGVRETQNSHQIMAAAFGSQTRNVNFTENLALVDLSIDGIFAVEASADSDDIRINRLNDSVLEVLINGQRHVVSGAEDIVVYTNGDDDRIVVADELAGQVSVIAGGFAAEHRLKVDSDAAEFWNGTRIADAGCDHDHGHGHDHEGQAHDHEGHAHDTAGGFAEHDHESEDDHGGDRTTCCCPACNSVNTLVESLFAWDTDLQRELLDLADRDVLMADVGDGDSNGEQTDHDELTRTDVWFTVAAEAGMDTADADLDVLDELLTGLTV